MYHVLVCCVVLVAAVYGAPTEDCFNCPADDIACKTMVQGIITCWNEHHVTEEEMEKVEEAKSAGDLTEKQVKFLSCTSHVQNVTVGPKCDMAEGAEEEALKRLAKSCERLEAMDKAPSCSTVSTKWQDEMAMHFNMAKTICNSDELVQSLKDGIRKVIAAGKEGREKATPGHECAEVIFAMIEAGRANIDQVFQELKN